ncbi:MAG: fibrobacter succinogenes major paralogous domain-containing protein [Bacteroidales bacterium]|nr:fibrobacter succinogenes major paralogous domain-containing protein [Bacteroidales bacterium]
MLILAAGCDDDPVDPVPETATMMDIDSNVYQTVKIGGKWWMAEDLRVTHYRDGSPIPLVQDINDTKTWNNMGACCTYNSKADVNGLLYNFLAVEDGRMLAPTGWHIPSDEEWQELEEALGMSSSASKKSGWRGDDEGDALKKVGLKYWVRFGDVWPTNESGFSGEAGGCRMFNNRWSEPLGLQYMGFWWTSSPEGSQHAWYRHLDYKRSDVFRATGPRTYGFSVRCVKDVN